MRILVVDDDPGTLNAIKAGLISFGHEVLTAENGRRALKIIESFYGKQEPLNLLLTDMKMPGMNGLELVMSARRIEPDLYAIIMTAYGEEAYVRKRMEDIGGCGYVDKPFRPETLQQVIEKTRSTASSMHST